MHVHTVQLLAVSAPPLSHEEKYSLRFAAGCVTRKTYKNLQESSHPEREGKAACIKEMIGGCEHASEDDTDAWLTTIDRGGLWHANQ